MSEVFITLLTNTVVTLGALFTLLAGILALQIQRRKKREAILQRQIIGQIAQNPKSFSAGMQPAGKGHGREAAAVAIGIGTEHVLHPRSRPPERPAKSSGKTVSTASDQADDAGIWIPDL